MDYAGRNVPDDATLRLSLFRPTPIDVPELFELCSDPRVWEHFPSLRHADPQQTTTMVDRWSAGWDADGLSSWVARGKEDGRFLGYGGCSLLGGAVWNLGYRFAVAAQGRGLATELSWRALARAREVRPDLPVVAYLLEHNAASGAVARKLGFTIAYRGPDAGNPDPAAVRLIFADRPLSDDQLAAAQQ